MKVQVCSGKRCKEKFSNYSIIRLQNDAEFYNWNKVEIIEESCMGQCKKGPIIKIKNQVHNYMTPAKASEIVSKSMKEEQKNRI